MSQYGEPWKAVKFYAGTDYGVEDVNHQHAWDGVGVTDQKTAERIAACVNFCQEFPTEQLVNRRLLYVTKDSELVGKSLADIEGFKGLMAVTLTPFVEDTA